ncbi:MAG: serine esterase [Planctomycetes bacterium]|nr:serine esterase [Planctomycetota bacterium]
MPARTPPRITTLECEWLPSPRPSRKLLVVLHGRGDSSRSWYWLPGAFAFEELNYLFVNAPDEYFGGRSWYALPPDQAPGVLRSRRLLDALFAELTDQGHAAADLGLLGFSQGCLMTLEWGARSPLRLGAYVGISGYCLDPAALLAERDPGLQPDRWLITHGTEDEALDYETTRAQIDELSRGGLALRFETFRKGHTIDPEDELPLLRRFVGERLGVE